MLWVHLLGTQDLLTPSAVIPVGIATMKEYCIHDLLRGILEQEMHGKHFAALDLIRFGAGPVVPHLKRQQVLPVTRQILDHANHLYDVGASAQVTTGRKLQILHALFQSVAQVATERPNHTAGLPDHGVFSHQICPRFPCPMRQRKD